MENPTVDIFLATDLNFIPYTCVTLASLLCNYNDNRELRIFILTDTPLPETDLQKFKKLQNICKHTFITIPVTNNEYTNIKTSKGVTDATYFRLKAHELLPPDCEKAVYIDGDTIIQKSIHDLYDIDMRDHMFCGVEDSISVDYNKKFGMPAISKQINAGVLLINVKEMREIFNKRIEAYLEINRHRVCLGDQQIICEALPELISYLPLQWNVHGAMFQKGWADSFVGIRNMMDRAEAAEAIANPAIIHYTLKRKPWRSLDHPKASLWIRYLRMTDYCKQIDIHHLIFEHYKKKIFKFCIAGIRLIFLYI